jgi:hypothetical protein
MQRDSIAVNYGNCRISRIFFGIVLACLNHGTLSAVLQSLRRQYWTPNTSNMLTVGVLKDWQEELTTKTLSAIVFIFATDGVLPDR